MSRKEIVSKIAKYFSQNPGFGIGDFSQITNNVFITNFNNGCDIEKLVSNKIDAVLFIGTHFKRNEIIDEYRKNYIHHYAIPVIDSLHNYYDICYDKIHSMVKDEKRILVHCYTGTTLSFAAVVYYFLKRIYVVKFSKPVNVGDPLLNDTYKFNHIPVGRFKKLADKKNYRLQKVIEFVKMHRLSGKLDVPIITELVSQETALKNNIQLNIDAIEKKLHDRKMKRLRKKSKQRHEQSNPPVSVQAAQPVQPVHPVQPDEDPYDIVMRETMEQRTTKEPDEDPYDAIMRETMEQKTSIPEEPSAEPEEPDAEPAEPDAESTTESGEPAAEPEEPSAEPDAEPEEPSAEPDAEPEESTTESEEPAAEPSESNDSSNESSEEYTEETYESSDS